MVAVASSARVGRSDRRPTRSRRLGQNVGTGLQDDLVALVDQPDLGIDSRRFTEGAAHLDGKSMDGGDGGGVELDGGSAEPPGMDGPVSRRQQPDHRVVQRIHLAWSGRGRGRGRIVRLKTVGHLDQTTAYPGS